jgi:hypothetical protein
MGLDTGAGATLRVRLVGYDAAAEPETLPVRAAFSSSVRHCAAT